MYSFNTPDKNCTRSVSVWQRPPAVMFHNVVRVSPLACYAAPAQISAEFVPMSLATRVTTTLAYERKDE